MEEFGRRREDWVINDTPLLLGIVTFDLRLMNLNRSWERILGYPRAMLAGKPLTRLIDQGEHALALTLLNSRTAQAESKPIEFSLRCYDGSYRCFEWERRPAREEEGVFISGRDITERKRMETTANLQKYLQSRKSERPA
ncbi:MAG: PAS domain S-box protein [Betaproteobacteria bacterium]|nr:MAG: PAS domain S-box protein [Betaproteobacteria bacterium]